MYEADRKKMKYVFLNKVDHGNTPSPQELDLTYNEHFYFMKTLKVDGYIQGVYAVISEFVGICRLTEKGVRYLELNSNLRKSFKAAKVIRE
ncbi:YjcQ family protein [Alkalicoccus halolimnae]|uniref:YjcQ family protein n=1 Tax=Alkalicoccus halolimnae TaxID=1667239 RepID=A0A5C7F4B2_9BACI|nr:YjcQ family protein [Alkalicoccus halolimnae]TXF83333.1 hypothetical protein FTX54_13220 [Alkalicoccus halolimnae]